MSVGAFAYIAAPTKALLLCEGLRMNSPNYPPPGPYGPPQGQPYGQRPPQTPPGGQPYGGPPQDYPPQGPPYGAPPPQDYPPQGPPYGAPPPQGPPYGAPPPQGQPFGGPPPGGFGPPPGGPAGPPPGSFPPPAPGGPPPAPAGKSGGAGTKIKIGIGIVVVAVGVVFGIINWGTSAASAKVGECIKVNSASASDADVEKIDCNSKDAAYKVAATFDDSSATCPEGDYDSYSQGGRRTSDVTLCLMLNAKEGDCFSEDGQVLAKVDCGGATFQVVKVLTGTTDVSGCPEASAPLKFPEPDPVVHCLGAPGGATGTT
jgi:hypothetical protein